jgi:hypothetical protein
VAERNTALLKSSGMERLMSNPTLQSPATYRRFPLVTGIAVGTLALCLLASAIPFFWDSAFFSAAADDLYRNFPSRLIPSGVFDTGGFPLYPLWMTLCWKLAGKTLLVSHLAMFPFLFLLFYQIMILAERWLRPSFVKWALLLVFADATLFTQSILMAYDILLSAFFLSALNSLFKNKAWGFVLWSSLLVLSSVRGIALLAVLLILYLIIHKKNSTPLPLRKWLALICVPLLVWLAWLGIHTYFTGWTLVSPARAQTHESLGSAVMFIRQFAFSIWKLLDFGRIFLWMAVVVVCVILFRKKQWTWKFSEVLLTGILCWLIPALVFSLFNNPIGHRYFLPAIILSPLLFLVMLEQLSAKPLRILLLASAFACLISGNFWMYPERYGNGWDASAKVIPWFSLQHEIERDLDKMKIQSTQIGTEWPVFTPAVYTGLQEKPPCCSDISGRDIRTFNYILKVNISNSFSPQVNEELNQHWQVVKIWSKANVYSVLYKNPEK